MGEGWELDRIEFLYGYLYQIDWRNPETGAVTRTFVKDKVLYSQLRGAVKRGAEEAWEKTNGQLGQDGRAINQLF